MELARRVTCGCHFSKRPEVAYIVARLTEDYRVEQIERFRLVFVERVALGVGAQIDPLAQMVERQEMVFPGLVQQLQ